MDWLSFIVAIVKALAWPLAVLGSPDAARDHVRLAARLEQSLDGTVTPA